MMRIPHESDDVYLPVDAVYVPLPAGVALSPSRFFPPPTYSTDDGLVCFGGRLEPEWLLDAYSHGIFPWPMSADHPLTWCSPDPRAIIELDQLHVSRRLQRTLRSDGFDATCNRDFHSVIRACATTGHRRNATWITPAMIDAYHYFHTLGHAHSVEIWQSGQLVGGAYGVAIGGLFAAESMFHSVRDASKVALVRLVEHLAARGYQLLDIQQLTPHTASMGAIEIPRADYLRRLVIAVELPVSFGQRLELLP